MKRRRYLPLAACVLFVMSSTRVAAQPAAPANTWSHGTTINAFAGVASASAKSGALAGGAAGWEITPRFGLEGSASWLDRPGSAGAFAATLAVYGNLAGPRTAVPFVKGGVGLYRTSFDSARDEMPDFYRHRLGIGGSAFAMMHTFTDPSLVLGGGVNVFMTRHLAIRPEIDAIVVRGDSRSYAVTAVMMHVAYHFEEHPGRSTRK